MNRLVQIALLLQSIAETNAWSGASVGRPRTTVRSSTSLEMSSGGAKSSCRVKYLILPGFGNDQTDYISGLLPSKNDVLAAQQEATPDQKEAPSMVRNLLRRGLDVHVLPVARADWIKVFVRGAGDVEFWRGNANPTRPAFRWYLEKVKEEVDRLCSEEDGEGEVKVVLVGHSAGGWLARAAIGYGNCESYYDITSGDDTSKDERGTDTEAQIPRDKILGIASLGAPHLAPPPSVMDMTRGALRLTNELFPGSYHLPNDLFYVTVAGDAVRGVKQERSNPFEPTTPLGFAYNSYEAVCGDGEEIGDGVVPTVNAHLTDSIQITLDGVFHSVNTPNGWYGSDGIIDDWLDVVVGEVNKRVGKNNSANDWTQNLVNNFSSMFK